LSSSDGPARSCAGWPDRRSGCSPAYRRRSRAAPALPAGHEDIENTAANRIFADFANRRDAVEAVALQPTGDVVHAHLIAGSRRKRQALDDVLRRHLLQHGVDGDEHDRRMRLFAWAMRPLSAARRRADVSALGETRS
jgi:hypothetical protein